MVGTGSRNRAMVAMDENDEIINKFPYIIYVYIYMYISICIYLYIYIFIYIYVYIYIYAFICLVNTCSYWIILIRWVVWWCMYHYTSWWMVCKYRFHLTGSCCVIASSFTKKDCSLIMFNCYSSIIMADFCSNWLLGTIIIVPIRIL